jgi:hypothetical protein
LNEIKEDAIILHPLTVIQGWRFGISKPCCLHSRC